MVLKGGKMKFLATKKALAELIRGGISEKSVLMDRAITKHELNPLEKLLFVTVEIKDEETTTIRHPTEEYEKCKWYEIEYKDNYWQMK